MGQNECKLPQDASGGNIATNSAIKSAQLDNNFNSTYLDINENNPNDPSHKHHILT